MKILHVIDKLDARGSARQIQLLAPALAFLSAERVGNSKRKVTPAHLAPKTIGAVFMVPGELRYRRSFSSNATVEPDKWQRPNQAGS